VKNGNFAKSWAMKIVFTSKYHKWHQYRTHPPSDIDSTFGIIPEIIYPILFLIYPKTGRYV